MLKRTWLIGGAAILLTLGFGGSAAYGQHRMGAGPLLAASNGNPLREASCDVYVGGPDGKNRNFEVAITASPPPWMGGSATVIAQQTFLNVPPGAIRTLMTSAPMVPNLRPIFCIVEELPPLPSCCTNGQALFSTLSTINLYDDSIETVVGASGNTSVPNDG